MVYIQAYAIVSVLAVSLVSLVGIFLIGLKQRTLKLILLELVAFSVGALLGDVFIHILPEISEGIGFKLIVGLLLLAGFIFSFVIEKFIHWHHCHGQHCDHRVKGLHLKPFAFVNLLGDSVHNFIDGVIIAAAYFASMPVGIATTVAVMLHEIPQEIGDFAVLIHGGFTRAKALVVNLFTALTALIGAILTLFVGVSVEGVIPYLLPFAAGTFLYIAASDLVPELHKETRIARMAAQLLALLAGVGVMALFLLLE